MMEVIWYEDREPATMWAKAKWRRPFTVLHRPGLIQVTATLYRSGIWYMAGLAPPSEASEKERARLGQILLDLVEVRYAGRDGAEYSWDDDNDA